MPVCWVCFHAAVPASPRLHSTLTTSVVTITDDDDPSGVFSLAPSSSNLQLSEGQSMSIIVDRMRGQFGPASVTISTVVLTSVVADQRASTSDFVPISTVLMFAVSTGFSGEPGLITYYLITCMKLYGRLIHPCAVDPLGMNLWGSGNYSLVRIPW